MTYLTAGAAIVLILCTASCASDSPTASERHGMPRNFLRDGDYDTMRVPPMDSARRISALDCRNTFYYDGGNLRCL